MFNYIKVIGLGVIISVLGVISFLFHIKRKEVIDIKTKLQNKKEELKYIESTNVALIKENKYKDLVIEGQSEPKLTVDDSGDGHHRIII